MLRQRTDGSIEEIPITNNAMTISGSGGAFPYNTSSNCYIEPLTYYMNYPVYICTDKTKKSIEILKMLQKEKKIKCDSVDKFIDLVEKISNIL